MFEIKEKLKGLAGMALSLAIGILLIAIIAAVNVKIAEATATVVEQNYWYTVDSTNENYTFAIGSVEVTGAATETVSLGVHDILFVSCSISAVGASAPPSFGAICAKSATTTTPYAFDITIPGADGAANVTTAQFFVWARAMRH